MMMPEMAMPCGPCPEDDRTSWIPVPFLSAKGQSQDRVKGLNTGADVYMVKPFEPEELWLKWKLFKQAFRQQSKR